MENNVIVELQWANANLPTTGKDEDVVFIHTLAPNNKLLLGVADGISSSNGRYAAQWVASAMSELASKQGVGSWSLRKLQDEFVKRLAADACKLSLENSHSTLSCGIAGVHLGVSGPYIRFDFFAVGDSPIWRVIRPASGELSFQASIVYGPPIPSEISGLYSWVNLAEGCIEGQIHFGSVDIMPGELLIVATDGVPESRVLFEDQDRDSYIKSPRLIESFLNSARINDALLMGLLCDYEQQQLLVEDDASLAVVRLVWPVTNTTPLSAVNSRNAKVIKLRASLVVNASKKSTPKRRAARKKRPSFGKRSVSKK